MDRVKEDFLSLRKSYEHIPNGQTISVSMGELTRMFFCTPRNAKLLIAKMQANEWLTFVPGRGRGNFSQLTFSLDFNTAFLSEVKVLISEGKMENLSDLANTYDKTGVMKNAIVSLIQSHFGYHFEKKEDVQFECLRFPIFRSITTLDPAYAFFEFDSHIISQVFNTLVHFDAETNCFQPMLAHDWECTEDGLVWTFHIYKGIRFHDGRALTAQDIKHSFERLKSSPHRWLASSINEIEIITSTAVQFKMKTKNHLFLKYLSLPQMSILPYSDNESMSPLPIGTGPFRIAQFNKQKIYLEVNDHYFRPRPHFDRIEIIRLNQYWQPVDFQLEKIFFNHDEGIPYRNDHWEEMDLISEGCLVLTFNFRKKSIASTIHFRKSMSILIDRIRLVQELGGPRVSAADGFTRKHPPHPIHRTDDSKRPMRVEQLLLLSGYKGEQIIVTTFERHAQDANWIQAEAKMHGIDLEIRIVDLADLQMEETILETDCILYEAVFPFGEVSKFQDFLYENSFLRLHLDQSDLVFIEKKIDQLIIEPDKDIRENLVREIEKHMHDQCLVLFLVHKKIAATHHPSLRGVHLKRNGWIDFKELWIHPQKSF
ncbi:ABC transporter substrate-binding protein [Falsibacillus albus]|uniref:SgrR family transcriptional regulator n=1 Tax=Falsibacillus albus TaxID=2478915 RepID=A0A3L7JY45_9BACI|nr:ABC transporter substrate-binding protein [Falsibacillus albus]RLQ95450.1 hypothetical protein D9X91_10465 [Falsibacillus albus]